MKFWGKLCSKYEYRKVPGQNEILEKILGQKNEYGKVSDQNENMTKYMA